MYTLSIIKTIFSLLDRRSKVRYIWLQLFCLVFAVIQIAGIASIAPFIGIVSNPDVIQSNKILNSVYIHFGFSDSQEFIVAFAFASLALITISNLISGVAMWFTFSFSIHVGSKLQNDLFRNLLDRGYIYHKVSDHTKAIALINQEAPRFVYMVLQPFLNLTSQLFIAVLIVVGLFVLDPMVAASATIVVCGSYLATYMLIKRSLVQHGKVISERNAGVQATLSEAFIGIKEIIIGNKSGRYKKNFDYYNRRGLVSASYISLAGELPRLVIETIVFAAILLLAVSLIFSNLSPSQVVSTLSLYGLAGYKLLPAMQQIYKSLSSISAQGAVAINISRELSYHTSVNHQNNSKFEGEVESIELRNVSFKYPNSDINALNGISVKFEKDCVNVIAGFSGSGKSTLADIVLGLLTPSQGTFLVNGDEVDQQAIASYQTSIGYVPQNIFLTNESVLANVAFGVEPSEISHDKVSLALKLASAEEFVLALPQGGGTILGQDGKLLSGGQRQRIGIARALYHDTTVLILDEPTSALDIHSEHDFLQCLHELKHKYLIILISHSPSVIKMSDKIYLMSEGGRAISGKYSELMLNSPEFIAMMKKADQKIDKS